MITVSIDPATKQVAMFSLPRDTVDVPLPPGPGPQRLRARVYRGKINSFCVERRHRSDLFPGNRGAARLQRLKAILGELYGLDIKYYVEVNFEGFRKVVDALGGVTINVQVPVLDDNFPGRRRPRSRLYIPAGIQHMDGDAGAAYARSRNSIDRLRPRRAPAARAPVAAPAGRSAALIRSCPSWSTALGQAVRTDIPVDQLAAAARARRRRSTRATSGRSSSPRRSTRTSLHCHAARLHHRPDVDRIRAAVANAFTIDPARSRRCARRWPTEGADVWVLNGTGRPRTAARAWRGTSSTTGSPRRRPARSRRVPCRPTHGHHVYNGAESASRRRSRTSRSCSR